MAPPQYKVLGERAAEVDNVRLEPTGPAQTLTEDQVQRLADAGVTVEPVGDDGDLKPLGKLRRPELVERAEAAGLDTTGTVAEIVERLEAHDATINPEEDDR